ncbi:MAG: hypothetical protein HXY41_11905 [Chloroflexi bacterium]|nr:hypothetical protein [Chloroflexota bacterium]
MEKQNEVYDEKDHFPRGALAGCGYLFAIAAGILIGLLLTFALILALWG